MALGNLVMPDDRESTITINGFSLNDAQSMTMRVAIESFASHLVNEGLGDDETGVGIRDGYLARIREIRKMIFS